MEAALDAYRIWFNEHRPHEALGGRTPAEVRDGIMPARDGPRIEPRNRMPHARASPDGTGPPSRRVRSQLELVVSHVGGLRELPVVELREAA
jgi:hypothetical protein